MHSRPATRALVQGASRGIGLALTRLLLARSDVDRVVATCRHPDESSALGELRASYGTRLVLLRIDVCDEETIARAAEQTRTACERLHLLVNCAGVLHDPDGLRPEKRLEHVDPLALRRAFEVNAFGPLLMVKHFHPLLRHDDRAVLANLSARVGSIGDDRAGGWYAYRASKAAQNMFTKNIALELRRRAPRCICVALHPGTVDTDLSRPFQGAVPEDRLFDVTRAAQQLLDVIDSLQIEDTGTFLAWDRTPISW